MISETGFEMVMFQVFSVYFLKLQILGTVLLFVGVRMSKLYSNQKLIIIKMNEYIPIFLNESLKKFVRVFDSKDNFKNISCNRKVYFQVFLKDHL